MFAELTLRPPTFAQGKDDLALRCRCFILSRCSACEPKELNLIFSFTCLMFAELTLTFAQGTDDLALRDAAALF
jgi:hypothetical protein